MNVLVYTIHRRTFRLHFVNDTGVTQYVNIAGTVFEVKIGKSSICLCNEEQLCSWRDYLGPEFSVKYMSYGSCSMIELRPRVCTIQIFAIQNIYAIDTQSEYNYAVNLYSIWVMSVPAILFNDPEVQTFGRFRFTMRNRRYIRRNCRPRICRFF